MSDLRAEGMYLPSILLLVENVDNSEAASHADFADCYAKYKEAIKLVDVRWMV